VYPCYRSFCEYIFGSYSLVICNKSAAKAHFINSLHQAKKFGSKIPECMSTYQLEMMNSNGADLEVVQGLVNVLAEANASREVAAILRDHPSLSVRTVAAQNVNNVTKMEDVFVDSGPDFLTARGNSSAS
jgi:hypothetical protein